MRLKYYYTVDGGLVPSHHQAHSVEIHHNLDSGRITIGLNERFDSVDAAQNEIFKRYDYVRLNSVTTSNTKNLDLVMKSEPLNSKFDSDYYANRKRNY